MTTLSAVRSIPTTGDIEEIEVNEIVISNKLYLIDEKKNVYSIDTHDKIGTLNELEQAANCDKVCKNIGRLPLELRHAIFNCLTVDFRLEMVLQKTAHIIRTLYEAYNERILNITTLKKIVNTGIRYRFFYHKVTNGPLFTQPNLKTMLPNIEFKQMGEIISTQHPVFRALLEIVVVPNIHGSINSRSRRFAATRHARDALTKIVTTITKCCDILPTLTVHKDKQGLKFNYHVRKHTFQFICLLNKFISKFEVQVENAAIEKSKQRLKQKFKRTIGKYIPAAFRKMQCKIRLSAKKAKAAAIKAQKEARLAAKKAATEAKEAKAATKKAEKEAKEAAKKAAKEARETKVATKKAEKETKEAVKKEAKEARETKAAAKKAAKEAKEAAKKATSS